MTPPLFDDEPNAELSRNPTQVKARQSATSVASSHESMITSSIYEHELKAREDREHREKSIGRYQQRIEPTHAEHWRRRSDQIDAMRGIPYLVALLVIGEPAFCTFVQWRTGREDKRAGALFPPPARRWSFATEG